MSPIISLSGKSVVLLALCASVIVALHDAHVAYFPENATSQVHVSMHP